MDFTEPAKPVEIRYFDRGPVDANMLILAGPWSAYWYNGFIYSSEIARGLDIFELASTKDLTRNEIEAAKAVRMPELNVQSQKRTVWPRNLIVAKAYVDQLERSKALPSARIAAIRRAIQNAETSGLNRKDAGKLKAFSPSLEKGAGVAKNPNDAARFRALAEILRQPEL